MEIERQVRLFRNGRNQAVRIPREFELQGTEAIMRKEGRRLIIEPIDGDALLRLLASWDAMDAPFPNVDDSLPPIKPVRL